MQKEKKCGFMYADAHELDEDILKELQKKLKPLGVNLFSIETGGTFFKLAICPKGISKKEAEVLWDEAHPEEWEDFE